MRHEKGTCTMSILVRRAHVMVPVHGWRNVGILGHRCQAASLCRHTLLPLKIALQRWGGGTEGLVVFNSSQSGSPEGLRLRIGAKNCPPERWGVGAGMQRDMGLAHKHRHKFSPGSVAFLQGMCVWIWLCVNSIFISVQKQGQLGQMERSVYNKTICQINSSSFCMTC